MAREEKNYVAEIFIVDVGDTTSCLPTIRSNRNGAVAEEEQNGLLKPGGRIRGHFFATKRPM
jgi:hypothetical protein